MAEALGPEPMVIVEALLFASDVPVEADRIRDVLELTSSDEARTLIRELADRYDRQGTALQIVEVAGGFRMVTRSEVAPWLVRLARNRSRSRLSRAALEALALVAYRQPVSRPEIDAVRGVNSEGVLDNLLERRLIRPAGRKDAPGRPFLYETTREFLVAFGLRDLGDLPPVDGHLIVPELPVADDTEARRDSRAGAGESDVMSPPPTETEVSDPPGPPVEAEHDDQLGVGPDAAGLPRHDSSRDALYGADRVEAEGA